MQNAKSECSTALFVGEEESTNLNESWLKQQKNTFKIIELVKPTAFKKLVAFYQMNHTMNHKEISSKKTTVNYG